MGSEGLVGSLEVYDEILACRYWRPGRAFVQAEEEHTELTVTRYEDVPENYTKVCGTFTLWTKRILFGSGCIFLGCE